MNKWIKPILILLGILLFACVIRVCHLIILPVFADEAIYIRWAQVMGAQATLRFLPLSDGKQPLFMWVLMFIVRRFSDPLLISRLLSVISGLMTLAGIFSLTYLLFKEKKIALIASFLWAISPIAFFFDRMALVDSMLTMFGVWTLIFAVITAKTKRLDAAMVTGFMLGFGLLTKSPALFFTLLIPVTFIYAKSRKDLVKLALLLVVTYIIGYGMYNILRLGPDFSQISARNLDYVFPISHLWTNPKDPFIFHIAQIFGDWLIKMGPSAGILLFIIGIFTCFKKNFKEVVILFAWFLIPILIESEYSKTFTVRYILISIPFFIILCSISISQVKSKTLKTITLILLIIFIIQSLVFDKNLITDPEVANLPSSERSGYLEEWSAGTGIKEVADYLKNLPEGKKINVGTEGYFGTLPDGLEIYLNDYPAISIFGTGLDFTDVPQQLKSSYKNGDETYFVVNSSRIKIKSEDYEKLGLKLIKSYPKAIRREKETHEYIWYGERDYLLFFKIVEPK